MSAGNDNIFARWSRRKQAVRHSETATPEKEEPAVGAAAAEPDAESEDQQIASIEPDAAEPPEPLPRLEDLTADSDLSAFLRKGVPKALKSAAMRKMWALDPAIRDYIGPSEYAWDFNQPGSMAGFGPLDDAGEAVADFLSTMSGGARAGFAKAIAAPETSPPLPQVDAVSPDPDASSSAEDPAEIATPAESLAPPDAPAGVQPRSAHRVAVAAEPAEARGSAESSRTPAPPRHGRALPR